MDSLTLQGLGIIKLSSLWDKSQHRRHSLFKVFIAIPKEILVASYVATESD